MENQNKNGTPFTEIFNSFLRSTVMREIELYSEEEKYELLKVFLMGAIVKFNSSKIDLSCTEDSFNEQLTLKEKYVLIAFMKHEYTKTFLYDDYNLAPRPTFRDMGFGSQAAYLRELEKRELRARDEANEALTRYSRNNIENFKGLGGKVNGTNEE